ncbi:MAG: glycosyltransferase family 2 protein [Nocardioides sp.]|uniref:glycosyltransferase n=1 Tax=Nocardioides sp. TaxID=35761 RepID=UPI0039E37BC5
MRPTLSVVVPFYGVERYLATCLDSLVAQSLTDFEAILVDDGSPDGSLAIAERYAAADDRFRIVRQENAGLGPARNTGAEQARGEYLTFVDSDDAVPPRAYERMVGSLERTGSDLAAGDARRFNDQGVRDSWVHRVPFARERLATHVRAFKPLALDRMAWNKVYRRSFFEQRRLRYPAGLYEDYPVTIRSHVLATQVDVLATPVYYWRERDGGDLSITQRVWQIANLRDRVDSDLGVLDFVAAEAPELLGQVQRHFLQIDLPAVVAALHRNDAGEHPEILDLAQRLLAWIDPRQVARIGPFDRVQAQLVAAGRLPELEQLVAHRARHGTAGPVVRRGRLRPRYYRVLPFLDDRTVGVPLDVFRVDHRRLALDACVTDARFEGSESVIECRVGVSTLSLTEAPAVRARLCGPDGRLHPVAVSQRPGPTPTRRMVEVRFPIALLAEAAGHWTVQFEVRAQGLTVRGPAREYDGPRTRWTEQHELRPGLWAKPQRSGGAFGVTVRRAPHLVTAVELGGDGDLVITGTHGAGGTPVMWFGVAGGGDSVAVELDRPTGDGRFRARVSARAFAEHGSHDRLTERTVWAARLAIGTAPPVGLLTPTRVGAVSTVVGSRRVTLLPGAGGNLTVHEEFAHPLVDRIAFAGVRARIDGRVDRQGPRWQSLRLRRYVTPADPIVLELPVTWTGDRFGVEVDLSALVKERDALEVETEGHAPTPWDLLVPGLAGSQDEPVLLDVALAHLLPAPVVVDGREVRVSIGRMARLGLTVADG